MSDRIARTGQIAHRYWLVISFVVGTLLLLTGLIEVWFGYRDDLRRMTDTQLAEAKSASERISDYLRRIETQILDAAEVITTDSPYAAQNGREEFHRLLKLVPDVFELRAYTEQGLEELYISRVQRDRVRSGRPLSETAFVAPVTGNIAAYGPTYVKGIGEPYVPIMVKARSSGTVIVADLNLKFVSDVIRSTTIGTRGAAYLVDRDGLLIAHSDMSLTLQRPSLARLPQVRAAIAAMGTTDKLLVAPEWGESPQGAAPVLTSAVALPAAGWIVFVEQPRVEALAPILRSLGRSVALVAIGLVIAFVVARFLAHALSGPILALRASTDSIAKGDLSARIDLRTGDEIELLADDFNQMAGALQRSYEELEDKVAERTKELASANATVRELNARLQDRVGELERLRQEADRANTAKTRFLASASHDLRQPMHAIGLLVGILGERVRRPEERQLVDKVQRSVDAMEKLFSSLLDISKLDAGAVRPDITDFELEPLLRLIELNYGPSAQEKGLSFSIRGSSAIVRSDPALLERVLANLVTNAIRYTERGHVHVRCCSRETSLRILVIDSGVGIAPDHVDDIFEEFVQLENPERDRNKGLGLGLSIVKRTVELLGHRLIVRSWPGRGSIFGVEVPAVGRVKASEAPTPSVAPARDLLSNTFVVVIDDDEDNRFALASLFAHWGCHVLSAASAAEAVAELAAHLRVPDLLVSDYRLRNGQTGVSAVEVLREAAEEDLPAIILAGDIQAAGVREAHGERVAFMHKPVSPRDLREICENLLAAVRAREQPVNAAGGQR